jgi:hypothetical protein
MVVEKYSNQDSVWQTGGAPSRTQIVNQSANDDEEIVETFILNKVKE